MRKLQLEVLALLAIIVIGCTKNNPLTEETQETDLTSEISQELLTIPQINKIIDEQLRRTGDFSWDKTSDQVLWSATVHGSGILTIGYGDKG